MKIMAWVSLLSHKNRLVKWFIMQSIKQGSTLRVSPKREKPSPRIIYRYGKEDQEITEFLEYRKIIKKSVRTMKKIFYL